MKTCLAFASVLFCCALILLLVGEAYSGMGSVIVPGDSYVKWRNGCDRANSGGPADGETAESLYNGEQFSGGSAAPRGKTTFGESDIQLPLRTEYTILSASVLVILIACFAFWRRTRKTQ